MSEEPRRFSGPEVEAILGRAASADARADLPARHDSTLDDLMAAARDAGIDPALVRQAAAVELVPIGRAWRLLLGAALRRRAVATARPSRSTDFVAVARTAGRIFGVEGQTREVGQGELEWSGARGLARASVRLRTRGDTLEIGVTEDRAADFFVTYALLLVGVAAASSALGAFAALSAALGPLVGVAVLLGLPALIGRPIWMIRDRGARRRVERAAMELARLAEEGGREGQGPAT